MTTDTSTGAPPRDRVLPREVRVLLVEDNPGDVRLVQEALHDNGIPFSLDTAARLADGIERLGRDDHDVVLLDLGLPDSQGLSTFQSLQDAHPDVPVVILTVGGDEEQAVAAVAQGAQDYLVKDELPATLLPRAVRYAIERNRLIRDLEHLTDDLRTFIAHAAHDLRTPIATVAGLAETLQTSGDRLADDQLGNVVAAVRRQANRVSEMIGDLLDLAKIHVEFEPERIDVQRAVDAALRDAPPPATTRLHVDLPAVLPPVAATSTRLERLITNLLTNAYRHGGTTVTIRARAEGRRVLLTVADDGDGIPEDLDATLFDPFTRGAESGPEGTGLGLAIVDQLARSLGGDVTHTRDPDLGGARFEARLPTWADDEPGRPADDR